MVVRIEGGTEIRVHPQFRAYYNELHRPITIILKNALPLLTPQNHRHTDHGTTTFLFSVPITALQIWKDEEWKFVPYKPGALVINLGEVLEVISGGHLKATLHKVAEPPVDQAHEKRLSLVLFNASKGSMRLSPIVGWFTSFCAC